MEREANRKYTVNRIDGFNPYELLVPLRDEITDEAIVSPVTGEEKYCLTVDAQIVWFRSRFPEGSIVTERIPRDDGLIEFHAEVYGSAAGAEERPLGTGSALRIPASNEAFFPYETAETMAVARALRMAGFGAEVNISLKLEETPDREEKKIEKPKEEPNPFEVKNSEGEVVKDDIFAKNGVKPFEKKEETPEESPVPEDKETCSAGDYIIKPEDVAQAKSIRKFAGRSLEKVGKNDVKNILDFCGEIISEELKSAAAEYLDDGGENG